MTVYTESNLQLLQPYGEKVGAMQDENGMIIQKVAIRNGMPAYTSTLGAAGALLSVDCSDAATVGVAFSGTFSATFAFEVSVDGSVWYPLTLVRTDNMTPYSSTGAITAPFAYQGDVSGFSFFRVRASAYTSGAATVRVGLSVVASDKIINTPIFVGAAAVSTSNRLPVAAEFNSLCVYAEGADGAALTLTLPSVSSQYHFIDLVDLILYSTTDRVGGAAPILVTTTNLPGSPKFVFNSKGLLGESERMSWSASRYIRSSAVTTATTFVMPAVTGGRWFARANYQASVGM